MSRLNICTYIEYPAITASKASIKTLVSFLSMDTPATMMMRDFFISPFLTASLVSSGLCLSIANACWFSFSWKKGLYIRKVWPATILTRFVFFYLLGNWGHIWSTVPGRSVTFETEGRGLRKWVFLCQVLPCLGQVLSSELQTLSLGLSRYQQLPQEPFGPRLFLGLCRNFPRPLLPMGWDKWS